MIDLRTFTVHAMAMPFRVTVESLAQSDGVERAVDVFHRELQWADEVFSLWREDSLMLQYNRSELALDEGPVELLEVLQTCEWYRGVTHGAFDARGPHGLDPTGLVKSWAVARAARAFNGAGEAWMVDASGDVLVSGPKADGSPWRVGIADPSVSGDPHGTATLDVVELGGLWKALATSGGAQRVGHIWDPATGAPARHVLQASVVAHDLVTADVWATAIVAGGMPALEDAAAQGVEALVVTGARGQARFDAITTADWPSSR